MYNAVRVARSTRAWIETIDDNGSDVGDNVARSTRAWIETSFVGLVIVLNVSHALRVRGLKQVGQDRSVLRCVARSTRAWIETFTLSIPPYASTSRTLYACVD